MDRRLIKAGFGFQNWDMSEAAFHTAIHSWINNSSLPRSHTNTHAHTQTHTGCSHSEVKSKLFAKKQNKLIKLYSNIQLNVYDCGRAAPCTERAEAQMDLYCQQSFLGCANKKSRNRQIPSQPGLHEWLRMVIQLFLFNCFPSFLISVVFIII